MRPDTNAPAWSDPTREDTMFDELLWPIHPRTGHRAIAVLADGRPVWPILGGDGTDDGGSDGDKEGEGGDGDGDGGSTDKDGKPDWEAEARKWKSLARKHEGQAKANAKAADRLKELEDADKSELEKVKDRVAQAEKAAQEADLRALRAEIAHEKGLSLTIAKRLQGSNREELEADADELVEAFGKTSGTDDGKGKERSGDTSGQSSRPREKLRSGSVPDSEPEENDPRKLAAMVPRE